jgi:hypothetical protein
MSHCHNAGFANSEPSMTTCELLADPSALSGPSIYDFALMIHRAQHRSFLLGMIAWARSTAIQSKWPHRRFQNERPGTALYNDQSKPRILAGEPSNGSVAVNILSRRVSRIVISELFLTTHATGLLLAPPLHRPRLSGVQEMSS